MTLGDLHWGLVEPGFSSTHGIANTCLGPGEATYTSPGVAMIQRDAVACHYKQGNGPPVSVTPGDLHWGLVEPNCALPYSTAALYSGPGAVACQYLQCGFVESSCSFLHCTILTSLGPGVVFHNGSGAALPQLCHSICHHKSGNGPLESMTPGDLHWGLVEPGFSSTHGISNTCLGPGEATYTSPGVAMIQRDALACHYKQGNGPPVSVTPGDLHWGLVEPNCALPYSTAALCSGPGAVACQYLQCGFVESSFSFLHCTILTSLGPGVVFHNGSGAALPQLCHSICHHKSGNGPLESMTLGDLHWGLVEPGFSSTHGIANTCLGPGVATYTSPGVAMIQRDAVACHYKQGNGPSVSVTPGDLHWGLVEPNCALPYSTAALHSGPGVVSCKDLRCGLADSSCFPLCGLVLQYSGPGTTA